MNHHQPMNATDGKKDDHDDDEVAWVALELQKKALHRLLFRMEQDDKKKTKKTMSSSSTTPSSSSSSLVVSSLLDEKTPLTNNGTRKTIKRDVNNFRKSFGMMSKSDDDNSHFVKDGTENVEKLEINEENSQDEERNRSIWMRLLKFIQNIVKSSTFMKSLGWISVSSLATISLIKFLTMLLSLFNSHTSHVHNTSNPSLMDMRKQQEQALVPSYLIPPPIFQSIDHDDIPRSVKGRFYLHELSTLHEQFETDGVYGLISTSGSSSSKNHLEEGPLFIPITNIERFQEQRQKTKYSPSDIEGDINKNGLFGQMVQLESFRKSTVFNGD